MMRKDKDAEHFAPLCAGCASKETINSPDSYRDRITKSQHNILHHLTLTRIISIIMKSAAFFTKACPFHDQITNGDHISQFKQLRR